MIDGAWWTILQRADPDIIHSFTPLSEELLERIDRSLSPYLVQMPDAVTGRLQPYVSDGGLSFPPTPENLAKCFGGVLEAMKYVILDTTNASEDIQRFVGWNFGMAFAAAAERHLKAENILKIEITDRDSLGHALSTLATTSYTINPIQLCGFPNNNRYRHWDSDMEAFTVIVGDTVQDIAWFWDRTSFVPHWRRSIPHQLWLPTSLANDAALRISLRAYVARQASHSTGSQIDFVSLSVVEPELRRTADEIVAASVAIKRIRVLIEPQIPAAREAGGISLLGYTEIHRAAGHAEEIVVSEPDVAEPTDEHWMTDLVIEYRPELYQNLGKRDLWWRLPNRNHLALAMTSRPSRITAEGLLSIPMRSANRQVKLRIPPDEAILRGLILGAKKPTYLADARSHLNAAGFEDVRRSDKGRYLAGFVDVFGGLPTARFYLEQQYWRKMLDLLSNQRPSADDEKRKVIANKLAKATARLGDEFFEKAEGQTWLAGYVLRLARESGRVGRELRYQVFLEEARREIEQYNAAGNTGQPHTLDENHLKRAISNLLTLRVLLLGIQRRCNSCGFSNWYHIDEARQTLVCKGCDQSFGVQPQAEWHYKLNTLIEAGVSQHGLVAVVLALGHLLHECRSSFIWAPSLELRRIYDGPVIGDLDIVCILDGRFIIGEVKQTIGLFKRSHFIAMTEIARTLRPNEVVFSSLEPPNRMVLEEIKRVKENLNSINIDAYWLQLSNTCFESFPPH